MNSQLVAGAAQQDKYAAELDEAEIIERMTLVAHHEATEGT